jgi:glutathione S-transferase
MPFDETAETTITGFCNTPKFAHGVVRDLRLRWAFEEIGRPYRTELFDAMKPRDPAYRQWQPFGQVPAFDDGAHRLHESGAILLYIGEQDERLLPIEPEARWQAIAWCFSALNSVEPMLMQIVSLDVFHRKEPWVAAARPSAVALAEQRLASLSDALAGREWLAGPFSIADILMVTVLRNLRHTDIVGQYGNVRAYQKRGEDRPAFGRALADQLVGLGAGDIKGEAA